ncbi:YheT family hydrolase [Gynuella sp.]|uniref:YheT family hydrolase n=1 Tax=Gynuella sp. TaxID=2969146 RepID=UPI003D0973E9
MNSYQPRPGLRNPHVQSITPGLLRYVPNRFSRSQLELDDGDFLLLDWQRQNSDRLVILSHGLEGHSRRAYVAGMARAFFRQGYDALAWNFRSCGGQLNRLPRFYHSGATEDLAAVVQHAVDLGYQQIVLVGFSMGGNLTLVYLGRHQVPEAVKAAATFSVPCDLANCADQLASSHNGFYMRRFLKDLQPKIEAKARQFPQLISATDYHRLKNFHDFDACYTAPLHGFSSASDYWNQSSALHYLPDITIPTLLVNARDDSFLGPNCYPEELANKHRFLHFEAPLHGGHVGFIRYQLWRELWSEARALQFAQQYLGSPAH